MNFEVRPIREYELNDLLALYQHLHEGDIPPPQRQLKMLWHQILNNFGLHYLVGVLDERIVSSCSLAIIPNLTRGGNPYGVVENVVTHPDHRSKGFATDVLKHSLELAWKNHCYKVMLLTGRSEEKVLQFYENAGFQRDIKTGFIAYSDD